MGEECAFQIVQDAETALEHILSSALPQLPPLSASSSSLPPCDMNAATASVATAMTPAHEAVTGTSAPSRAPTAVGRRLLWSHHIKSSTKKKLIVTWARDLGITVVCKPGCVSYATQSNALQSSNFQRPL